MRSRSSRRLLGAVIACALGGVTACSLIYGLDGFATEPPGSSDAVSSEQPAPPADADAGAPPSDATIDTDADTRTFCQRAPVDARLCDEFERDAARGSWSGEHAENDASIVVSRDDGGSYLRTTMTAKAGVSRAYLDFRIPGPVSRIHYAYRVRVVSPVSGAANIMVIAVGTLFSSYANVGLTISGSSTMAYEQRLGDGGPIYKTFALDRVLTPGVFHDVDVTIELDRSPARIVVLIDGVTAATRDSQVGLVSGPDIQFQAGVAYTSPTPSLAVDIDDVLIEKE